MSAIKTLRLLMPQWQGGGNNPAYSLGARLLEWLAPKGSHPTIEVPIDPYHSTSIKKENGIIEQSALLKQLEDATTIIHQHHPQKIVVFGGDCLVEQAPISYLNQIYDGNLGVLWMDAHPDVTTPKDFQHEHAMVLGNLLGEGDPAFAKQVPVKLNPKKVMLGGLQETMAYETEVIQRLGLRYVGPKELSKSSNSVIEWIKEEQISKLFIHIDLDVLNTSLFRSLLFANPYQDPKVFDGIAQGAMTIPELTKVIQDILPLTEIVGLGITEHMPWDAIHLQEMLEQIPILKE